MCSFRFTFNHYVGLRMVRIGKTQGIAFHALTRDDEKNIGAQGWELHGILYSDVSILKHELVLVDSSANS
jgi:hypothetical protein